MSKYLVVRRFLGVIVFGMLMMRPILPAQTWKPAVQIPTFHINGTARDYTGAAVDDVKVRVTFQNGKLSQTVPTTEAGFYETDLPLGVYTMTAEGPGFRRYRRPEFRVMSPLNITLDATLHRSVGSNQEYYPGPARERNDPTNTRYYDGDFFSVPSEDGVPLRLYISYVKRIRTDYSYAYTGHDDPPYDDPVFVAYNLFSLQANTVLYEMESRRLEARGNVVVEDESGKRSAVSMTFKIENGRAVPIQ